MKDFLKETINIDIDYNDIAKNVFCISIATKIHIRKDIDKIFNKNKLEYINYLKNSNIYKSELDKALLADVVLYSEKVLGILEKGLDDNDLKNIFDLYKKSHRKIYNHIKPIKKPTIKDIGKNITTGLEGNYEFIATMYMFSLLDKEICDINCSQFYEHILNELLQLSYYDKTNYSKSNADNYSVEIKEIRDYLGLDKRTYTGEEIIDIIVDKDIQRYNASKVLVPWEMITSSEPYKIEKIGEIAKYVGSYEGLFKYLKINSADVLKRAVFTPSEINSIILNYILSKKLNSFKDSDKNIFLISIIYITALNKVYSELKSNYLKSLNEDFLQEIATLQSTLEKSIYDAKKSEESLKEKENNLLIREKELLERINQLEKENKKLKQEIKENENLKQEVVKLRNVVFDDLNVNEEIAIDKIDDINIEELNNDKVIIFGGSTNWVNNMKEKLPNVRFAGVEYRNTKLDFIKKDSIVFINTNMSHAFYYKIKDVLYKTNIDYYYIDNSSNINKSLLSMQKELLKNK